MDKWWLMNDIIIKKYNHTHNKIICEPGIAMEISEHFTFDVPGAKFMPQSKFGWDGKIRIFNSFNKLLYCGLTYNLEYFAQDRNYTIEYEIDNYDIEFSIEEAKQFIDKLKPKYQPRDYQIEAFIHAVRKNRALFLSPTSSGKSLMIYLITCWFRLKTLIIVPTTGLVGQMSSDFEEYGFPSNQIHKIMSGTKKDSDTMVVCSTWQSVYKLPESWFEQFDVVIGDEAHLFKAKSLIGIMTKLNNCKHRFGFTGTLDGSVSNSLILEGLFGKIKKVTTTAELMEQNHVAELMIKAIVLKYPEQTCKYILDNDYHNEIDYIVTNDRRNKFIKNLSLSLEGNVLIFFQLKEKQGKVLYDMLTNSDTLRPIYYIDGDVDGNERNEMRKRIENEKDAIIIASSGTSSTGVNIINLSNIIFSHPSKARVKNLQSIGRGLRRSDLKTNVTLYDIADDLSWKSKKNHSIIHFLERIKIYNQEKFKYKIYNINFQ
jgi:superfamily II DNA or RNA helicase